MINLPKNEKQKNSNNNDFITVVGAREHNLKNLRVQVPKNKITVFTGLSGSGKSSLAFDTIYAEGQRRYIESLSSYARNFLEQLKKPEMDSITGITPAIAIDQKSVGTNPRSTVGTVTEIYDYLRLLFARVGEPLCPQHKLPVTSQSPQQILEDIVRNLNGKKFYLLAPMAQGKKGEFLNEFQKWAKKGFVKAKVDGAFIDLEKANKLAKTKAHNIDLVVDQIIMNESMKARLSESIHLALSMAHGNVVVETLKEERFNYSIHSTCPSCGFSFPNLEPRLFSFNNPRGACLTCHGLGTLDLIEEEQYDEGEVGGRKLQNIKYHIVKSAAKPGSSESSSEVENEEEEFEIDLTACPDCNGSRLRPEARNVIFCSKNISELSQLSAKELFSWFQNLPKQKTKTNLVAEKIITQIMQRLDYLIRVGTGYLSVDRPAVTLSGGEAQRIRLASQVGSSLIGVLYVMDEPSIGLHPRDHHRLLEIIKELKDRGNTILLVEHDEDTIRSADFIVDLGPRAGSLGGEITAQGTCDEIMRNPRSLTGQYLSGTKRIEIPNKIRSGNGHSINLIGARGNNLKSVNLILPLGKFIAVTGVSGSGKSTLIIDTLYRVLAQKLYKSTAQPKPFDHVNGIDKIDKVIDINQKPIGRTPRSTPATYVGLFPLIRDLFAQLPEAKVRGYKPGHFSFNVKGGRCEACLGHGQVRIEMHFLSDVYVQCDTCQGRRYSREILNIKFKNKSIADVLEMTVGEATDFFRNQASIHRKLETLHRVGLDYMTLGQSSTTISGGEAQRVKLSKELSRRGTGATLYILDEPTTGLHFDDIRKLVEILHELVDQGNTLLVIEHNLDVVKCADHIIDLGPDGGDEGGMIVGEGDPRTFCNTVKSETARFLKKVMIPNSVKK